MGGGRGAPSSLRFYGTLWAEGPRPRGSFLEQKTDDEVSRKHIIDDKIGYRTKKWPFQNYIPIFNPE